MRFGVKEGEIFLFALTPDIERGRYPMYLTLSDFCQLLLVIIGILSLTIAITKKEMNRPALTHAVHFLP